jgi:hypothetical protein
MEMWKVEGVTSHDSHAPTHPDLVVQKYCGKAPKVRTFYVVPQMAPENNMCVYNSTIATLERGIKERVLFIEDDGGWKPAPAPEANRFEARLSSFERALAKHLPSTTPVSHEEFVGLYKGRKQVVYQKAVDSLKITGISSRDFKLKAFVKPEKGKLGSAPRVIQPRDPRCNVEIGCYLKPIEERVYKAIAKVWGGPTVMKGYNARKVAAILHSKWKKFSDPVGVGLDAKRFDQHVSVPALQWEHRQYVRCFRDPDHKAKLSWLLRHQLRNSGVGYCTDGKLKYSVRGKRMSGDMNTALGNCLLMCAMIHAYSSEKGVVAQLANNGDDCVVFMERRDLARFQLGLKEWFLSMGFQMIVEPPAFEFEHIEFCQARPVFDGTGYTMVRNLRAFTKDACALIPIESEFVLKSWLGAVGDAGMSLTGGIPIWQEFYSLYQRSAGALSSIRKRRGASRVLDQSAFETGMAMSAIGMERVYGDVTPEARYSFWLAFGVLPDHQVALEDQYRCMGNISVPTRDTLATPDLPPVMNGFMTARRF